MRGAILLDDARANDPTDLSGHVKDNGSHYYVFRTGQVRHSLRRLLFGNERRARIAQIISGDGTQDLVVLAETAEILDFHAPIEERTYIERLRNETRRGSNAQRLVKTDCFGMFVAIVVQWIDGVCGVQGVIPGVAFIYRVRWR